jgi:hypothetical protein
LVTFAQATLLAGCLFRSVFSSSPSNVDPSPPEEVHIDGPRTWAKHRYSIGYHGEQCVNPAAVACNPAQFFVKHFGGMQPNRNCRVV